MSTQTAQGTVACGNPVHKTRAAGYGLNPRDQHHHLTTVEVRRCFADPRGLQSLEEVEVVMAAEAADAYEFDADAAYERHLESAGWAEARAEEEREAAMGILSYEEARDEAPAAVADDDPQQPIRDGLYTISTPEGGHRTFRLRTQKADAKFAPGQQFIAYLAGPDNEADYVGFGFVVNGRLRPWKKYRDNRSLLRDAEALLADPNGALTAAHCFRCGRTLTTPESIAAGWGPECIKRGL